MGITDGSGKLLGTNLHWADILIIILYFVIVMAFGLWSSFRNRGSVGGYFLAGRSMHWIPVGASLFASNIGSGHFIGLAGSGAATGIGIACFELNALFVLLILGWVFVPVYIAAGVFTMPEYIRKRFGGQRIRIYLSVLALLLSIFTKVAADLFAGATFIEQALRWNLYLAIVILLAIAALFTIAGGLTAVIWTDFIQTVIMLIGAAVLMVIGFIQVGGYTEMIDKFLHAFPNTTKSRIGQHDSGELYNTDSSYNYTMCGVPTKYSTHLFRPADDPALPWPGITFGLTISAVWYWCSDQVGGFEMTRYKYMQAVPNTTLYAENRTECGRPPANAMHFFRSIDDPVYPWTGALFGVTISSVWYWCSDQVIVQRALAAKDLSHAKAGTILAGYLKILPMWLLVLPGMMARILFPNEVGCADPDECESICGSRAGCTNIAYPMLVIKLMPDGARGLMLAVMMAALMSSLTSIFNSSSTIFTMDIWRRIRKNASDVELMIVGRVFVLFMVAIGILWIPIVQNFSELFHYIQSITSFLAPPICAVYVVAVLWKRANEQGAFWSLMIGLVVGLIRFIWEFSYPSVPCGEEYLDNKPAIIGKVHYLHFGIILFGITVIACVIISLLTEPIDEKYNMTLGYAWVKSTDEKFELRMKEDYPELPRLTFWDRYSTEPRVDIDREEEEARAKKSMGVDNLGMTNSADVTMTTESSSNPNISEPQPKNDIPIWKKALQWICGIEKHEEPELTAAQRQEMEDKQTSLYEKPKWRRLCNINAILLMVVAIFFWGFFY